MTKRKLYEDEIRSNKVNPDSKRAKDNNDDAIVDSAVSETPSQEVANILDRLNIESPAIGSPMNISDTPQVESTTSPMLISNTATAGIAFPVNNSNSLLDYSTNSSIDSFHSGRLSPEEASSVCLNMNNLDDFAVVDPAVYHSTTSSSYTSLLPDEVHMLANTIGIDLPHIPLAGIATSMLALLLTAEC
jgi:hypothetical protein